MNHQEEGTSSTTQWLVAKLESSSSLKVKELARLGTGMQCIAEGKQPIAKCECAMLPALLLFDREKARGRSAIWCVDNTAALHSVVKGASSEAIMEDMVSRFWLMAYKLQMKPWVEYIDSGANWSDGIGRSFGKDTFVAEQRFQVRQPENPLILLYHSLSDVMAMPEAPSGLPT